MSSRRVVGIVVGAAALVAWAGIRPSVGQPLGEYALDVDEAKGMQAWMESTKPGRFHEFLGRFVGEWETQYEMFMGPGAPPMTSKGEATIRWQLPGRWAAETNTMEFMGQRVESFVLMGYDNVKRQFVGSVVDTMSTEMRTFRGGLSPDGKVLTMFGEMDEPITGEHAKMVRYQTTIHDEDHFTIEVSEILYGEAWAAVRVKYVRKK